MLFEWDEAKSDATLRERGFDFAFAARIFAGPVVETVDDRKSYGERRVVATGSVGKLLLTVVFTDRATGRRIISARMASSKERTRWQSSANL